MAKCWKCEEAEIPEPEYCCDGRECGCYGMPIDPPYCDKCWDEATSPKADVDVGDFDL